MLNGWPVLQCSLQENMNVSVYFNWGIYHTEPRSSLLRWEISSGILTVRPVARKKNHLEMQKLNRGRSECFQSEVWELASTKITERVKSGIPMMCEKWAVCGAPQEAWAALWGGQDRNGRNSCGQKSYSWQLSSSASPASNRQITTGIPLAPGPAVKSAGSPCNIASSPEYSHVLVDLLANSSGQHDAEVKHTLCSHVSCPKQQIHARFQLRGFSLGGHASSPCWGRW